MPVELPHRQDRVPCCETMCSGSGELG
jgi:hypothetical protein